MIPRIGEVPLSQLTGTASPDALSRTAHQRQDTSPAARRPGLKPKTVRSVHLFLHAALEQAVRAGVIAKNPTTECKPPKLERKEMKVIQTEQIGEYLQAAAERNVLPLFFLGVNHRPASRRAAGAALERSGRTEQKHFSNKIRRAAGWRAGSEQAQDPAFHPHPDRSPAGSGSTDPGTQSASEQSLSVSFPCHRDDVQPRDRGPDPQEAPQGRRTGRLRFHDLRHTFATLALQNGVDIKTLSGMLGHYSSGFTLDTYTHVTRKMQEKRQRKWGNSWR